MSRKKAIQIRKSIEVGNLVRNRQPKFGQTPKLHQAISTHKSGKNMGQQHKYDFLNDVSRIDSIDLKYYNPIIKLAQQARSEAEMQASKSSINLTLRTDGYYLPSKQKLINSQKIFTSKSPISQD